MYLMTFVVINFILKKPYKYNLNVWLVIRHTKRQIIKHVCHIVYHSRHDEVVRHVLISLT